MPAFIKTPASFSLRMIVVKDETLRLCRKLRDFFLVSFIICLLIYEYYVTSTSKKENFVCKLIFPLMRVV